MSAFADLIRGEPGRCRRWKGAAGTGGQLQRLEAMEDAALKEMVRFV